MFARVNTFQGKPEDTDRSTTIAVERAVPTLKTTDGSAGIIILGDRQTGKSLAITLWGSEEALRASEEMANKVRSETTDEAGEEIISVERYEVLHEERW